MIYKKNLQSSNVIFVSGQWNFECKDFLWIIWGLMSSQVEEGNIESSIVKPCDVGIF